MSAKVQFDDASIKRAVEHQVTKALHKGGLILKGEIYERTPINKDPKAKSRGQLRQATAMKVRGKEAIVSNATIYARRVEYGFEGTDSLGRTYHQAPKPYMSRGAKAARPKVERAMRQELMRPLQVEQSDTVIKVGKK